MCEYSLYKYIGKPTPTVTWYRDDLPITAETFETPERRNIRSEITLGPLGRQDLNTRLSCKAINHPRATPLESTVQIDMNCKCGFFYLLFFFFFSIKLSLFVLLIFLSTKMEEVKYQEIQFPTNDNIFNSF